jgi:anti-sigma factor RsiW
MNAPPAGALRSAAPEARKDAGALNESVATGTVPPEPTLADKPGAPASSAGGFLEQALLAYGLAAEPGKETAGTASSDDARAGRDAELDSLGLPGLSLDLAPLGFDLLARRDIAGGATAVAGVAFVFADRQGRRVMLFVSAAPAELPGPGFQWLQRGPLQVVAWSANSGGFALVGPLPRNALQALARAVAGQTFN